MKWRPVGSIAAALFAVAGASDPSVQIIANSDDSTDEYSVGASGGAWEKSPEHGWRPKKPELPAEKYLRADEAVCVLADLDGMIVDIVNQMGVCDPDRLPLIVPAPCEAGTYELQPLWVQRLQPDGTYGTPEELTERQCVTPVDVAAQAQQVFATMHVPAPAAHLQGGSTLLVNAWYPVYADADPVARTDTLLGVPVEIQAVPAQFTWDFDDPFSGAGTLTTTDPGEPWARGDGDVDSTWVAHAWTRLGDPATARGRAAGTAVTDSGVKYRTGVTVTLTTTWRGQFRIAGTVGWTQIPGAITTTSTAGTFTVSEARGLLVCDDLRGGPSC